VVRNVRNFLEDVDFRGKRIGLLGYGTIGAAVGASLVQERAVVTVYDPDPLKTLQAPQAGFQAAATSPELVRDKFLIIGTSGQCTVGWDEVLSLSHGSHLASPSSEQYAFGIMELEALSDGRSRPFQPGGREVGTTYTLRRNNAEVTLLANGYPVNFWEMESMPNQASDLVLSLLLLAAVDIASSSSTASGVNSDRVDELAAKHDVARLYSLHHHG
jgi:S-adenosylhomocysteine hydrolase